MKTEELIQAMTFEDFGKEILKLSKGTTYSVSQNVIFFENGSTDFEYKVMIFKDKNYATSNSMEGCIEKLKEQILTNKN